jgi:hypothetical protein
MALVLNLFGALAPLMAVALRGQSREVKPAAQAKPWL